MIRAPRSLLGALLLFACTERPSAEAPPPSAPPAEAAPEDPRLERYFGESEALLRSRLLSQGILIVTTATSALRPDLLRLELEIRGSRGQLPAVAKALAELEGPSALGAAEVRGSTFSVAWSLFRSPRRPSVSAAERQRTLQGFLRLTERQLPWTEPLLLAVEADCLSALVPLDAHRLRLVLEPACAARAMAAIGARLGPEVRISAQGGGSYELRFPDHVEELSRVSSSSASR